MAVTLEGLEPMLRDLNEKIGAIPKAMPEAQIRTMLQEMLDAALADPELPRKMKFQKSPEKLQGTKFARWNLSIADVEFLHDMQVALAGQRKMDGSVYQGPSAELQNTFKAISEARYLSEAEVKAIDQRALDGVFPRISKAQAIAYENAIKAMDTAESGYGSQLVGAQYVGQLWDVARRESRIFGLINSFEMTAPTAYLPVEVDFPELLFVSENTANNSSDYTTVKTGSQRVQVDAKKFVVHQMWSGEMEEDSIIPFIPFLQMQAAKAMAHYLDSLVLNGDTTNAGTGNINLDDADPADTKHYLAFDGIRHVGLVDNTNNQKDAGGAVTYDLLRNMRGRMIDTTNKVDWGHPSDPNDLVYVTDPQTGDQIELLDEVLTVQNYAENATVLTGEVVKIGKNPLVVSMAMSKTEADGKVSTTGSNNVKGQVAAFNRRGFVTGWRRRVKLETMRLPGRDQTQLVYSMRLGFGRFTPTGAASGIEAADVLYDITLP